MQNIDKKIKISTCLVGGPFVITQVYFSIQSGVIFEQFTFRNEIMKLLFYLILL